MKSFATLMTAPISFIIFRILSIIFIGVWTYRDAKNKNNKDYIIWTIVSVVVPYYLGVILYILVGRKTSKTLCENCHNYTESNKPYCSYCGEKIEHEEDIEFHKNNNIWAILSIVSLVVAFVFPMVLFGSSFFSMRNNGMMSDMHDFNDFMTYNDEMNGKSKYENGKVERTEGTFNWNFKKDSEKMTNKAIYNKNGSDVQKVQLKYKLKSGNMTGKIFIKGNEIETIKFNDKSGSIEFDLKDLVDKAKVDSEENVEVSFIFYPEDASGEINMNYIEANIN